MAADVVLRALKHAWTSLEPLGVPMAVMGGLALAAWKQVRATRDVDLLVGVGATTREAVLECLVQAGMRPKQQPSIQPLGRFHLLQLLFEPHDAFLQLQVDILFAEGEYQQAALCRRVPLQLPEMDIEISVLACEDLVIHKLLAGRVIDQADIAALLRSNRSALDLKYLTEWVHRLDLGRELSRIWCDAFPGESAPL